MEVILNGNFVGCLLGWLVTVLLVVGDHVETLVELDVLGDHDSILVDDN